MNRVTRCSRWRAWRPASAAAGQRQGSFAPWNLWTAGRGRSNGHAIRFLRNAKRVKYTRLREILAWLRETSGVNPAEHIDRPLVDIELECLRG